MTATEGVGKPAGRDEADKEITLLHFILLAFKKDNPWAVFMKINNYSLINVF